MRKFTVLALLLLALFGCSDSSARQELTVVCMRYVPGPQPLQITDQFSALSASDIALLQKCVPHGTATVWSKGVHEKGPAAKAILLLTGPFERETVVAQPWRSTAVYVQQGQEVVVLSKDAPLWDKRIYLEQQTDNVRYTTYMADLSTGGRQGGSAVAW